MSATAQARVVWMLAGRSMKQAFRRPQLLAPILIFPTLFLVANTGGADAATTLPGFPKVRDFFDFQLAAAMLQSCMLAGVSGGTALAIDFETGFTDRLLAAPIPRTSMVIGRLAATGVMGIVSGVWFLAIGLLFGAEIAGGVGGALVAVTLTALAACAFGGLGAALALRSGKASVVQGTFPIVFVILFLSSAFFPAGLMLEPAKTVAEYNPLSWIADGVRAPIVFALDAEPVLDALGGILLLATVSFTLSWLALRARLRSAA